MLQSKTSMTISQIVTTPAARRAAQTYRYHAEAEPVATDLETCKTTNLQSLDVCVAQPDNLELLEIIVELKLPGYRLRQYSVPKTCNEF